MRSACLFVLLVPLSPPVAAAERAHAQQASVSLAVPDSPITRRAGIDGPLGRFSRAEAMTSRDVRVRRRAAQALARFGPPGPALAVLHDALSRERSLEVRYELLRALGRRADQSSLAVLREALSSTAPIEVRLAVEALRAIGGEEGARALVAALASPLARPSALEACVELGALSLPPLVEALHEDPSSLEALEALVAVLGATGLEGSAPLLASLEAASASPSPTARALAVRALGLSRSRDAAAHVRARLADTAQEVVREALEALGHVGDASDLVRLRDHVVIASPHFEPALRAMIVLDPAAAEQAVALIWPSADEARRALVAASVLALGGSVAMLEHALEHDEHAALSALAAHDDPRALELLAARARGAHGERARFALALALRRRGGASREHLRALGDDPFLLALAGEATVLATLERRLVEVEPEARAEAALGLELLGRGRAALLAALLREQDPSARRAQCAALDALGVGSTAPLLDRALTDPIFLADCGALAARAQSAMSPSRRRAFRVAFRRGLRHPDAYVACASARALALSRDVEAIPALLAALEQGGVARRIAAARALRSLGADEALTEALRGLESPEARRALARLHAPGGEDVLLVELRGRERGPLDVELASDEGVVRRVRARSSGFVVAPFTRGAIVEVRAQAPRDR